jgi:hypothetical protein
MKVGVAIVSWLACVSCTPSEDTPVETPKRSNLEVVGSPECLGKVVGGLGLPVATLPTWKEHLGRLELGPIEEAELPTVVRQLREVGCIKAIRVRACRTPHTDVDLCNAPSRMANGS